MRMQLHCTPVLRSAHTFSFRTQCLFCGQHGTLRGKNWTTMYFQNNRLSTCSYAYLSFKRRCMGWHGERSIRTISMHQMPYIIRIAMFILELANFLPPFPSEEMNPNQREEDLFQQSHRIRSKKLFVSYMIMKTNNMIFYFNWDDEKVLW